MSVNRSLISPTSNPLLEQALRKRLARRAETTGGLGELEALAVRLGLIQNTLKPRFRTPQIAIFAADHGLAGQGLSASGPPPTATVANPAPLAPPRQCRSPRRPPRSAPAWRSPIRWPAIRSCAPASALARTRAPRWCS